MLAASLEWPFALRMALRVSTREDLTAGSDESQSRPLPCTPLVSAGLDLRRPVEWGLLGIGPSALGTMMLPVAVERSVSPALLVIEQSSAELEGPSWMAGRRTEGPSPCPRAWTWHLSTPPWAPDMAIRTWRVVCWRMSQTYQTVVRPIWQTRTLHGHRPFRGQCLADSGQGIHLDVAHSWQMDGNQRNRLAVPPLEQPNGHLHQSVRSRAPLVLDVRHRHCVVAHQSHHSVPQMR